LGKDIRDLARAFDLASEASILQAERNGDATEIKDFLRELEAIRDKQLKFWERWSLFIHYQ
jgi:hypothetical protein